MPHHDILPDRHPRKILIAEDDVLLRIVVAEVLRDGGLTVIEAANADEALAYLRADKTVDLVFVDVVMPGSMDGIELVHWIRIEFPGTKIMMTSGQLAREGRIRGVPFIPKPFIADHILAKINAALDEE
jgi:CheY-like chemotaxis protein